MDEQEKDQTRETGAVLAEAPEGAADTTGEAYTDADRRQEGDIASESASVHVEDPRTIADPEPTQPLESGSASDEPAAGLEPTDVTHDAPDTVDAEVIGIEATPDETVEVTSLRDTAEAAAIVDEEAAAADDDSQTVEQLLMGIEQPAHQEETDEAQVLAILEAIVYITDEPLSAKQIADALQRPLEEVRALLDKLVDEYNKPYHGLTVKEVAGGYKMSTKAEHHEAVRSFVKNLNPPLKLSLAALETLAVIAYKQPITAPEIMEIRGVQGAGVLKTLLDRKLITSAGRKNVVGKPILYKTTKEFLVQFGLRDLNELPSLKEFEDLRRFAFSEPSDDVVGQPAAESQPESEPATQNE
jgi:segregation and condensation protein B